MTKPSYRRRFPVTVTLVLLAAGVLTGARGQATWSTQVVIPNMLTIRVPTTILAFAPGSAPSDGATFDGLTSPSSCPVSTTYPPPRFPACYPLDLSQGTLPVDVFSNILGPWSLLLDVSDLTDQTATARLPADRIWYRVGSGAWHRAAAATNPLYFGTGPTDGYLRLDIQLMLELDGNEQAGSYTTNAVVSGVGQP